MTINFSFAFFFHFSLFLNGLLWAMTYAIDGFPSWSITSRVRIVLASGLLVQSCLHHYCQQKVMAQKCFREMGNFWSMCPEASIKVISEYHDPGILFCLFESVWQVWNYSKSWCIPNYQISVFSKNSSFFVAWFPKISREFANQESYGQLPEKAWSNGLFDFSKSCPSGHQGSQNILKGRKFLLRWVHYQQ